MFKRGLISQVDQVFLCVSVGRRLTLRDRSHSVSSYPYHIYYSIEAILILCARTAVNYIKR